MMAFALEDGWSLNPLYDPSFIRFYAIRSKMQDGVWMDKIYNLKQCTEEEFSKFYEYENRQTQTLVENLRSANQFFCIDMRAMGIEFFGSWQNDINLEGIAFFLAPCASRITLFDGSTSGAEETCIWDQQKVEAKYKAYNMVIYRNVNEFQQDNFGEDIFVKKSVLQKIWNVTKNNPNFKDAIF